MAASDVLHERVAADHDRGGAVALEAAHWSESGLQAAVVGFDPVVGVPARVVERTGHEIFDRSGECMGLVGGDLDRVAVVADRRREEPGRGLRVAFVGDVRVDDLPMLVDCPMGVLSSLCEVSEPL